MDAADNQRLGNGPQSQLKDFCLKDKLPRSLSPLTGNVSCQLTSYHFCRWSVSSHPPPPPLPVPFLPSCWEQQLMLTNRKQKYPEAHEKHNENIVLFPVFFSPPSSPTDTCNIKVNTTLSPPSLPHTLSLCVRACMRARACVSELN